MLYKKLFALCAICAAFSAVSCSKDEPDNGSQTICDFEGSYWDSLIDDPQYGGKMLYSTNGYFWTDSGTGLYHNSTSTDWGTYGVFWTCGHAISNYTVDKIDGADYNVQLSVVSATAGKGGHNGSANFAIHYGYDNGSSLPELNFPSGTSKTINYMYVNNTAYVLNVLKNGNYSCPAISEGEKFGIKAVGFNAAGEKTGECEFILANGPSGIIDSWTKWDLSSLGQVAKVSFEVFGTGKLTGSYGLNAPAYFAYDDVCVTTTHIKE